jgi:hypothetical protein
MTGLVVPAYFAPNPTGLDLNWNSMMAAAAGLHERLVIILNPPLLMTDPPEDIYISHINTLQSSGARTIGYVNTCWNGRWYGYDTDKGMGDPPPAYVLDEESLLRWLADAYDGRQEPLPFPGRGCLLRDANGDLIEGANSPVNPLDATKKLPLHPYYDPVDYQNTLHQRIKTIVDRWFCQYPKIDGIFFDEASADNANQAYYSSLYDGIREQKRSDAFVVLNPGTLPDVTYFDIGDSVICVFENAGSEDDDTVTPTVRKVSGELENWGGLSQIPGGLPAAREDEIRGRSLMLLHSLDAAHFSDALEKFRAEQMGWLYFTNAAWHTALSTHYQDLVAEASALVLDDFENGMAFTHTSAANTDFPPRPGHPSDYEADGTDAFASPEYPAVTRRLKNAILRVRATDPWSSSPSASHPSAPDPAVNHPGKGLHMEIPPELYLARLFLRYGRIDNNDFHLDFSGRTGIRVEFEGIEGSTLGVHIQIHNLPLYWSSSVFVETGPEGSADFPFTDFTDHPVAGAIRPEHLPSIDVITINIRTGPSARMQRFTVTGVVTY